MTEMHHESLNETESDADSSDDLNALVSKTLDNAFKYLAKNKLNRPNIKVIAENAEDVPVPNLLSAHEESSAVPLLFTIDRSTHQDNIHTDIAQHGRERGCPSQISQKKPETKKPKVRMSSGIDSNELYINVDVAYHPTKKMKKMENLRLTSANEKIMDKCVIKPGFEQLHEIPPYQESLQILKKKRRMERDKTKGSEWYNMPAVEMSDEHKNDLRLLQMRKALDRKHFYKSNDFTDLPKYCQFGKIVETPADFYSSRIPKKQRKQTMADELLSDPNFISNTKKNFNEVKEAKRLGLGPYQMKRVREKKKDKKRRLRNIIKNLENPPSVN